MVTKLARFARIKNLGLKNIQAAIGQGYGDADFAVLIEPQARGDIKLVDENVEESGGELGSESVDVFVTLCRSAIPAIKIPACWDVNEPT